MHLLFSRIILAGQIVSSFFFPVSVAIVLITRRWMGLSISFYRTYVDPDRM